MIELYLPYPPSLNTLYSHTKYGVYLSKKGRLYQDTIEAEIESQGGISAQNLNSRLSVSVILFAPDRRKRDLDNYCKCLLDSLTKAGLWLDDSLIDRLKVYRGERHENGLAYVRIEPLDGSFEPILLSKIGL